MKIEMEPIGYVRNKVRDRKDVSWGEDTSSIILDYWMKSITLG